MCCNKIVIFTFPSFLIFLFCNPVYPVPFFSEIREMCIYLSGDPFKKLNYFKLKYLS